MDLKDNWTVVQARLLIASYKKFPCLWDPNHQFYRNKAIRKNCLKNIAKLICEIKPGTTIIDVRAKLKTLRSQFGKEKRRREYIESKMGHKSYRPKLWCYHELKYIDVEKKPEIDYQDFQVEIMDEEAEMDKAMIDILENDSKSDTNRNEYRIERRGRPSKFPTWTKEQTFNLLQYIKLCPLLYDTTHPLYAQPIHRAKAFRDILVKLKPIKHDVTIPDMRAKLKTLRSQYQKEKKIEKESVERRRRVKYIPKLWCFEHLKFLDERGKFLEEEREQNALQEEKEFEIGDQPDDCYVLENENEIYVKSFDDSENEFEQTLPSPINEYTPRSTLHDKCLKLVESLTKQMEMEQESYQQNAQSARTPQALLGKMVEVEMLKVSDSIFEETKWKIIKLLEEAAKKEQNVYLYRHRNGD